MPIDQESVLSAFPRGIILPWYAKAGSFPPGWAVCDGTNETPDLRGKFLMGVASMADVGQPRGREQHAHSFEAGTTTAQLLNFDASDGNGSLQKDGDRRINHHHGVSGSTHEGSSIPPSVTVLFIMKL